MSHRQLALIPLFFAYIACSQPSSVFAQALPAMGQPEQGPGSVHPMNTPADTDDIQLTLESPEVGLTVHARPAGDQALKLCAPPCSAVVAKGRYEFGAHYPRQQPVWSRRTFELTGDERVTVSYVRKHRGLGVLPIIAGSVIAIILFASELTHDGDNGIGTVPARVGQGLSLFGGLSLGAWMLAQKDEVTVQIAGQEGDEVVPPVVVEEVEVLSEPDVVKRISVCTAGSTPEVEVGVDVDASNKIVATRAPDSFGRGARRCIRQALLGTTLQRGAPSRRLLIRP